MTAICMHVALLQALRCGQTSDRSKEDMPTVTANTVTRVAPLYAISFLNDKRMQKWRCGPRQRGPHRLISKIAQSGMWHHPHDRRLPTPVLRNESPPSVCLHPSLHNHNIMAPSPTPNAPRTLAELVELLRDDEMVKVAGELAPKIQILTPGVDVDGVLRGKIMSKSKFLSAVESSFGFCGVVYGWDSEFWTKKRRETMHKRRRSGLERWWAGGRML